MKNIRKIFTFAGKNSPKYMLSLSLNPIDSPLLIPWETPLCSFIFYKNVENNKLVAKITKKK